MSSSDGTTVEQGDSVESTVDSRIDELIDERTNEIESRIDELETELSDVENYARISLGERRLKQNEANLSAFSESLTAFAERTFSKTNDLERRLEIQTLLLADLLEAFSEADDIDVDVSDVRQYQEDQLVTSVSADERLQEALEELSED